MQENEKRNNGSISPNGPLVVMYFVRLNNLGSVACALRIWLDLYVLGQLLLAHDPGQERARSIPPKFPEISVQNSMDRFEKTGPPFEVDQFSRSDRLEFWLNGSRPLRIRCFTSSHSPPRSIKPSKVKWWPEFFTWEFCPVSAKKVKIYDSFWTRLKRKWR